MARRRKSNSSIWYLLLLVFALGVGVTGWLFWDSPPVQDIVSQFSDDKAKDQVLLGSSAKSSQKHTSEDWFSSAREKIDSVLSYFDGVDAVAPKSVEVRDPEGQIILKIGLVSDSHGFTENMSRALAQMKGEGVNVVVHLGDFSAGGEDHFFREAKDVLDSAGMEYYVLPGDHDFNWYPSHSRENYENVFGQSYDQVVKLGSGVDLVLFDNSVSSINDGQKEEWLRANLQSISGSESIPIFFSPRPLLNPYFEGKHDPDGQEVVDLINQVSSIRYAFAGNTHIYSRYQDFDDSLTMVTVGAIGEYKNPLPQWVYVSVYDSGDIQTRPMPIINSN